MAKRYIFLIGFSLTLLPTSALAQLSPTVSKSFQPNIILAGGTSTLSLTVGNPNASIPLTNVNVADTMPTGVTISGVGSPQYSGCPASGTTGGFTSLTASLSVASLPPNTSCTYNVVVTSSLPNSKGGYLNTTGFVGSDQAVGGTASANLLVLPIGIAKAFGGLTVPLNGSTTLTFTITNPTATPLTGINFTDALPSGLIVSMPNNGESMTCTSGSVAATAGGTSVAYSGGSLAGSTSCSIKVSVTGTTAGVQNNTVSISSDQGGGSTSNATITVVTPPTLSASFGTTTMDVGQTTALTYTLTNPNTTQSLSNVSFTDSLSSGLIIATPNGLTGNTCSTTPTATAGGSSISFTGGTVAANASCTFTINVFATRPGEQDDNPSTVSSTESGSVDPPGAMVMVLGSLTAQSTGAEDAFQISYISQLNNADTVINITNAGTSAGTSTIQGSSAGVGNICLNIYVFDPQEEEVACCSCVVTPNELIYFNAGGPTEGAKGAIPVSVGGDGVPGLLYNTISGLGVYGNPTGAEQYDSAVVKFVATAYTGASSCVTAPNTSGASTITAATLTMASTLAPGLLGYSTHPHPTNGVGAGVNSFGQAMLPVNITETPLAIKSLSAGELGFLTYGCNNIATEGTGKGICSCPVESSAGGFAVPLR